MDDPTRIVEMVVGALAMAFGVVAVVLLLAVLNVWMSDR